MILKELNLSAAQKITLFKALSQDEEIQADVKLWFDAMLLTSELRPIQRIAATETVTGLDEGDDDEKELNIPEKIDVLSQKIERIDCRVIAPAIEDDNTFIPETKLGKAAFELIKYVCAMPAKDGYKAVTPKVLHHFREHILTEENRPDTVNPRQWKKDLTDCICGLSNVVKKDKKGNNRGIRLVFPNNFNIGMLNVSRM